MATTLKRSKGGQFALHAKALPGSSSDSPPLATVIPEIKQAIGNDIERLLLRWLRLLLRLPLVWLFSSTRPLHA